MGEYQIFISYRRDGGDILAGRIADRLIGLGYTVFHDVESMVSGLFNEQIFAALDSCDDVLVVLPKDSLLRCFNEDDWVRKEIAYAISQKKNIIPVMTKDFSFPDTLPEDIDSLRNYEGVHVVSEYFDALISRVCQLMRSRPHNENFVDQNLDNGIRFIKHRLYSKAVESLGKALDADMANPEVHFYFSIALLEGKRPFLCSKAVIAKAEEHLKTAISIEEKSIYYYLFAFIKKDFYENKMLKSKPTSFELMDKANLIGINFIEVASLFDLLNIEPPTDF